MHSVDGDLKEILDSSRVEQRLSEYSYARLS
jgi:hypothetical protein